METLFTPLPGTVLRYSEITLNRQLEVNLIMAAGAALEQLWHDFSLGANPLLFLGSKYGSHRQHQPDFLSKLVERKQEDEFHILEHWEQLIPPAYGYGIADSPLSGPLRRADYRREASIDDRNTVPAPKSGWIRYDFIEGWSALSIMLLPNSDGEATTITAIPEGRQDDWLAFLEALNTLHNELLHRDRKGEIDVWGSYGSIDATVIRETTFEDVILPQDILDQVLAQQRIFTPEMLKRYASFRFPRLRKALLLGPPGTGKTTLLKAMAARHANDGGYVIYVMASKKAGHSWENLSMALNSAARSDLPTLIIAEDFEQFVGGAEDMQQILNTLDGIATPDNPAGTLLLASTNDPEKIDRRIKDRAGRIDSLIEVGLIEHEELVIRFLKRFLREFYLESEHAPLASELLHQAGSHIREVCLLGMFRALEKNHEGVLGEDLQQAHEVILQGRETAAKPETCDPPAPKRRISTFFGKR